VVKFDHMNLPVTDPKASRDWYVNNFGFEVEFEVPNATRLRLRTMPTSRFSCISPKAGSPGQNAA